MTTRNIRSGGRMTRNPCDNCKTYGTVCWVASQSRRCLNCAAVGKKISECGVNLSSYKTFDNWSGKHASEQAAQLDSAKDLPPLVSTPITHNSRPAATGVRTRSKIDVQWVLSGKHLDVRITSIDSWTSLAIVKKMFRISTTNLLSIQLPLLQNSCASTLLPLSPAFSRPVSLHIA